MAPFASLDITGESRSTIFSLRQPLYVSRQSQIDLLGGAKTRRNDNWISDVFINRTETVDGNLGAGSSMPMPEVTGSAATATGGSSKLNNHREYWYGRGWLRRQQTLADQWSAVGALSFQNTGLSCCRRAKQFIIGGEEPCAAIPSVPIPPTSATPVPPGCIAMGPTTLGDGVTQMLASGFFFRRFRPRAPLPAAQFDAAQLRAADQCRLGFQHGDRQARDDERPSRTCSTRVPDETPSRYSLMFQLVANIF